jgi:hypothetical protein
MDGNVSKNNIDIPNKQVVKNKYMRVLGLKKACIVLQDCLRVENILKDISMVHNIPLQYRLINNKLKSKRNKESMISKKKEMINEYSKDYPLVDSCLMNRVSKVKQLGYDIRTVAEKQLIVMPEEESRRTKAIENKDIQKINKDLNVSELGQNLKKDKYSENCNSDCNNKYLVEEGNNIIHTPNKNSYKNKDLLSQKSSSTNQNGTNNTVKKRMLSRSCVPSEKNESFPLNVRSSDKEEAENNDCISLYANSTLIEE